MGERRDFRLLLISSLATAGSFGLLLPVVPLWAESGGAGPTGVGATNFTFLMVTVAMQLAAPRTLRALGHRESLVLGGALFGLPVFAYPVTTALPALVTVSALRGIGFALVVVTGSALVPRLLPAHRRGRGIGQYGLAIGLPNALCLPAGPWLTENLSFPLVFTLGGVLPLVGAAIALGMRVRTRQPRAERTAYRRAGTGRTVRPRDLAPPFLVTFAAALASSAFVTFLPAAVASATTATVGLLGYGVGTLTGRWVAGVLGDRYRRPVVLVPATAGSAVGVLMLVVSATADPGAGTAVAAAAGGLLFGTGFGAVQNCTLTAMFDRTSPSGYDVASTVWNMSIDAGIGLGSLALGAVAGLTGYPTMFAAAAALLTLALVPAVTVARHARRPDG